MKVQRFGRCISGSFLAHASYRVTSNCLMMGEAACAKACDTIARNISVRQLSRELSAQ